MGCAECLFLWCAQFHVNHNRIIFSGFTDKLPDDIGGRCYYTLINKERYAIIEIPQKVHIHRMLCKISLWHEFCHGEVYVKEGLTGHKLIWYKKLLRKPHMFLGQFLLILFWNRI